VLKLIYHTAVFGPIDLDYDRPVIRVGRGEDNDLVLRHPSVELHHCLLVFRGEKVLCLSPDDAILPETELENLAGLEYGLGDQIRVGELQFSLAHSARTVAIPEVRTQAAGTATAEGDSASGGSAEAGQGRYFCAHCRVFIPNAEVKRVGVVGHAKRCLCPKCSGLLDVEPEPARPLSGSKKWLRHKRRNQPA
jgi:hypothetical protein